MFEVRNQICTVAWTLVIGSNMDVDIVDYAEATNSNFSAVKTLNYLFKIWHWEFHKSNFPLTKFTLTFWHRKIKFYQYH